MINYMSAAETARLWGISKRRVTVLCKEKRIPGAQLIGNMWLIPKNAVKPADPRQKK